MIDATIPTASPDSASGGEQSEVAALIKRLRKWLPPNEIEKRAKMSASTVSRWELHGAPASAEAVIRLQALERELAEEFAKDFGKPTPL